MIVIVNGVNLGSFEVEGEIFAAGLAGNDRIVLDPAILLDSNLDGGDGNDNVQGGGGDDEIAGGQGDDQLDGGAGDDALDGGAGDDHVDGGQGSDTVATGDGNDTVTTDVDDDLGQFVFDIASPVAVLGDDSVAVRGQPLTVVATFPDPNSQVGWDFGDGGTVGGQQARHAYVHEGTYHAELTIVDSAGNQTRIGRDLPITPVAMQIDPQDATGTALAIGGTSNGDHILIDKQGNQGDVRALLDSKSLGTFAPTGHVLVYGQAGDDNIEVAGSIMLSAWLYGGAGNDRLKGGASHDMLLAGGGLTCCSAGAVATY